MKKLPLAAIFGTVLLSTFAAFATKTPRFHTAWHDLGQGRGCTQTITPNNCDGDSNPCLGEYAEQLYNAGIQGGACSQAMRTEG